MQNCDTILFSVPYSMEDVMAALSYKDSLLGKM